MRDRWMSPGIDRSAAAPRPTVNGKWSHLTRRPTTLGSTVVVTTMASGNADAVADSRETKIPVVAGSGARVDGAFGVSGFNQSDARTTIVDSAADDTG